MEDAWRFCKIAWRIFDDAGSVANGSIDRDVVKHLKELERDNGRLKRLVADQALDIQIEKEVTNGEF